MIFWYGGNPYRDSTMEYQKRQNELEEYLKKAKEKEGIDEVSTELEEFEYISAFDISKNEIFLVNFYIDGEDIHKEVEVDVMVDRHPLVIENRGNPSTLHDFFGAEHDDYNAIVYALSSQFGFSKRHSSLMLLNDCVCTMYHGSLTFTLTFKT